MSNWTLQNNELMISEKIFIDWTLDTPNICEVSRKNSDELMRVQKENNRFATAVYTSSIDANFCLFKCLCLRRQFTLDKIWMARVHHRMQPVDRDKICKPLNVLVVFLYFLYLHLCFYMYLYF